VPNSELAEAAGLDVAVGVTVDDGMHTSDPHIFAVGDVVDHDGRRYGLWPASVEQAQVAAAKMVGGEAAFRLAAQPARLKVPGINLLSIGVVDARPGESQAVALSAYGTRQYRKLVLENGCLTGAIILGSPELFDDVTTAVERRIDLGFDLDALEHGRWQALSRRMEGATLAVRAAAVCGRDMERQCQALLNMLVVLSESLRDLDDIVPDLEDLGARHIEYGATPEHYPVVGEVLTGAMAEIAGDSWKPQYTAAWQEAYGVVQDVMLSGASAKVE
jgi:hypothetical protein